MRELNGVLFGKISLSSLFCSCIPLLLPFMFFRIPCVQFVSLRPPPPQPTKQTNKHTTILSKVDTTQQVRKRTRAGMGWCQGQYCQPKVASLIARELGLGLTAEHSAASGLTGLSSGGAATQASGAQGGRVSHGGVEVRDWPESSLLESQHQHADSKN
jgi:hypothetical protein